MPETQKPPASIDRPLSPHLQIYRWQMSNGLSILHRMTGFGLAFGMVLLTGWLWGIAYQPHWFDIASPWIGSIYGEVVLFGFTVAFYYHFGNGIRHLFWDMGKGFALPEMMATGRLVLLFTFVMTAVTWMVILIRMGRL